MAERKRSVGIYTLGCKVNQYESEAIAEALEKKGFTILPPTEECGAYIINTCTVTAESDRKARQFIRRAIKKSPTAYIAVTGCLAETAPDTLCKIQGVDVIIGNSEKLSVADAVAELFEKGEKNPSPIISSGQVENAPFEKMSISRFERTRAYVKIEDGCENRCSYCIIPSARGPVRSKEKEDVLREVRELAQGGCREIVLTGIETASYGRDLGDVSLGQLLVEVDRIEGIGRVRLGSLDPSLINKRFTDCISGLSSLAPHFHLSLQSGSSRILALMKRKYNAEQAMRAIEALRSVLPTVQFTTDVIVGFPDETDEDFAETLEFIRRARFLSVHVFPYSKRAGTLAAAMKNQVPEDVKKQRLHTLETLVAEIRAELLADEIKKLPIRQVLFETYEDGVAYGHTAEFLEVAVPSDKCLHGELFDVRLTHTDGRICYGELIQN